MAPVVFMLCGAGVDEASWWEEEWGKALHGHGLCSDFRIRHAPEDGAHDLEWPHWWVQYHPKAGVAWKAARTSDTFDEDIGKTCGQLKAEIDECVTMGLDVAFVGASNGGHVAVHFAAAYAHRCQWLLLVSSSPLEHQELQLMHCKFPVVMTVGEWETCFGGCEDLRMVSNAVGACFVHFEGGHCREHIQVMDEASVALLSLLGR